MSDHVRTIFLSELQAVRLRCPIAGCGGVAEMPLAKLGDPAIEKRCPVCGKSFAVPSFEGVDQVAALARSMAEILKRSQTVQIEFPLPEKP
jgi:hypothetical protein